MPSSHRIHTRSIALITALLLTASACASDPADEPTPATAATTETIAPSTPSIPAVESVAPEFDIQISAEQVTLTGAEPGHLIEIDGQPAGTIDDQGNLIIENIEAGRNYEIADVSADPPQAVDGVRIPELTDHPAPEFFAAQTLEPGLNYIEMRDGTLLAAMVRLPGPIEDGPYPTVIEYSGYDPANPDSPEPSTQIYGFLGYATVGINMRGSGCSGGAFDYFEPLQSIDGYDAVEAVAAQSWVYGNKVGMVGISYPGISQLFVAATQPPSLAAITPLSIIEDLYRSVLYPGGIYNNGFAKSWGEERQRQTAAGGQEWVVTAIDAGDEVCEANQNLRSQNVDLAARAAENTFDDPAFSYLSPVTFVDQITVPTFVAGAFQDEQTGGRFATMLDDFTGTEHLYVHLYNGAHADSASPEVLARAAEFMDIHLADRVPQVPELIRSAAPGFYLEAFGEEGLELPADRFNSLDEARAAIESAPPVRLLLEMGGDPQSLGGPIPRGELSFDAWPPPSAEPITWYLGGDNVLLSEPNNDGGADADAFEFDAENSQRVTEAADDDGNEFDNLAWAPLLEGNAIAYETAPLAEDLLLAGSGVVELFVASTATDADLQVTISEIRPDGQEMYVQSGWLRASHRTVDEARSTALSPFHTHAAVDASPLPAGEFTAVQIEIFPAAHAFRADSRLRLVIDTPGGTRNLWKFEVLDTGAATHSVARTAVMPSSITLPFVRNAEVPIGLPPCPDTRSQPCRPYLAIANTPSDLSP